MQNNKKKSILTESSNLFVFSNLFKDFELLFTEDKLISYKAGFRTRYYDEIYRTFNKEDNSVTFQEQINSYNKWEEQTISLTDFCKFDVDDIFKELNAQINSTLISVNSEQIPTLLKICSQKVKVLRKKVNKLSDILYRKFLNSYLSQLTKFIDEKDKIFRLNIPESEELLGCYFHSDWFSDLNKGVVNNLHQELIDSRIISPISNSIFSMIFSDRKLNKPTTKKINWLKSEISFRYFIKKLVDDNILAKPFSKQMRIANKCISLNGNQNHNWVPGGKEGKYENAESIVIDRIIELSKSKIKERN
jgi:hypothetical protein